MKYGKILIQSFAVAMTGFGRVMRPYFNNLTNRAIKTPKIYFFDTGLVSFLCGWTSVQTLGLLAEIFLKITAFLKL